MEKKQKIALALDNISTPEAVDSLIAQTHPYVGIYKIGFEQFIRFGPAILRPVKEAGAQIFLDMKLHDIPNTVAKAVISASQLGVDYLTLHTSGGVAMMHAAVEAAQSQPTAPRLLGVTVLTSIDEETLSSELNIRLSLSEQVVHLARLGQKAGLAGMVCSAADLGAVRPHLQEGFEVVTPGIRPAGVAAGDQKRVATPAGAIAAGATMLVIGRAITQANDPRAAAKAIYTSI
ncbi:orotidine-5'-phosphate decarboxylase [Chitinivibrio alkaliphilus]|uniref:Orotidine 5'-phosphate decarboxylase n=1 Tax=Chitinivibrio alkaliphilus ACht1 TaxID=1313304 RepID=U7D7F9_9BACT|nr:orotidine-5'-phosphate decarboxylase [Chitinivibrio alkaliphilus]ERP31516.1 Orotidine-5'-phosphate decarboxylase [Chitinivibrio alkaliphilus ACht1]